MHFLLDRGRFTGNPDHARSRRVHDRLCRAAGCELEQNQFLLGHMSVQTTERLRDRSCRAVPQPARALTDALAAGGGEAKLRSIQLAVALSVQQQARE
jgi:hypothetical protein